MGSIYIPDRELLDYCSVAILLFRIESTDNIFSFKLFLYKVQYITESPEHNISNVIEAYIETSKDSYYLCNSIEYGDYISSKLVELYKLAKSQNASIKLDLNLKKLIQKFNNSK